MKLFLAQFTYRESKIYAEKKMMRIIQAEDIDSAEEKIFIHMDVPRVTWTSDKRICSGGTGYGSITDLEIDECL
jgi:hypothetical protein